MSSRGALRPWTISHVYLFDTPRLIATLQARGVKVGTATSVAGQYWREAEVFPEGRSTHLRLTVDQQQTLMLFS
jgi:hypothetical protein